MIKTVINTIIIVMRKFFFSIQNTKPTKNFDIKDEYILIAWRKILNAENRTSKSTQQYQTAIFSKTNRKMLIREEKNK